VISYFVYLLKVNENPLYAYNPESNNYLLPSIISLVMINVLLLSNPSILYGIPRIRRAIIYDEVLESNLAIQRPEIIVNVDLEEIEYFKELSLKIERYFKESKPYVKADFDLTDLTISMGVPLHHITICFRQYINFKFTDYKNMFRVEEAKQLLKSSTMDNFTIEAIGEQVGFQSKSNFFTSFKKITGLTPLEYKKRL
jgi:AraC-like DNA-binding protein